MEKIYIVTCGDLDDEDHFLSAHRTHQGAINVCVDGAKEMVKLRGNNLPNEEWTSSSDLKTRAVVIRTTKGSRFAPQHIAWWNIEEEELQE